jgi:hypothetical protein
MTLSETGIAAHFELQNLMACVTSLLRADQTCEKVYLIVHVH